MIAPSYISKFREKGAGCKKAETTFTRIFPLLLQPACYPS